MSAITAVYVGDLPFSSKDGHPELVVTEDFLRSLFSEVGQIVEGPQGIAIIKREDRNGKPYAFAFVNFQSREDADRAIAELNYTKLDNVPIRLSLADKETNKIRRSGQGNLFIKNLDPTIEVSQLHEAFQNFGEIISCKIPTDENGHSRGYGYVQFRKPEDADQAMQDLKDASINGRPVRIEPFCRRQRQNPDESFVNCYIKSLPDTIQTDEDLKALFSQFGEVDSPSLKKDENGRSRGFGFCSMKTHEQAVEAVQGLNGKDVDGFVVICNRAQSRQERVNILKEQSENFRRANYLRYKGRNLYVRNFEDGVSEEELRNAFSRFGQIESAKIMCDESGVSRKFGFVCFTDPADSERCIKESTLLKIGDKQVYVARAMSRDERMKQNVIRNKQRAISTNPNHQNALSAMSNPGLNPAVPPTAMNPMIPQTMNPMIPQTMNPMIPQTMNQTAAALPPAMNPGMFQMAPQQPGFFGMQPPGFPTMPEFGQQILQTPFQSLDPKAKLRQEIFEKKGSQNQIYLSRLRDISDEQAAELANNQELLNQWLALP